MHRVDRNTFDGWYVLLSPLTGGTFEEEFGPMFNRKTVYPVYADEPCKAVEPFEEKLTSAQWERRSDEAKAETKRLVVLTYLLDSIKDETDPTSVAHWADAYKSVRSY